MYVDGTRREGGMVERDYGRQVYERVVYQQKDPALLEWLDGSTFKMRVFPLEPRQEKRLILSYTQKLPALYGQLSYRFPAGHSLDSVREFSAHVRVKGGAKFAWASPSHAFRAATDGGDLVLDAAQKDARINRDVVLNLTEDRPPEVRFSSAEQDGARYLMLRYRPELPGVKERQRRDWIFLFEASGDRDPLLARTQIEIIRGVLAQADPEDTFQVLTANTRVHRLRDEPMPVTTDSVQQSIAFLEQAHLIGALDLGQALSAGSPARPKSANACLVHVGSGIAAMGERRDDELVKRLPPRTHYVGVGVGKRWNRSFMKLAAERTGGYFTQINPDEQVSWRAFELAATLDTPRLLDVRLEDRDGKVRFLPFARSLAQGEELAAAARLGADDKLPEAVVVSGTLNGGAFRQELAVKDVAAKADYLPRTWAKLEIERLLAEDPVKHKDAVVALSKAMYVMTPFTSLLVLENEEMYQQFKVDRGRKDHWAMYACPEKIDVVYEPEDGSPGDPKKGIKPAPGQVLKTIATRPSVRVLSRRDERQPRQSEIYFQNGHTPRLSLDSPPRPALLFGAGNVVTTEQVAFSPDGRWAAADPQPFDQPLAIDWAELPGKTRDRPVFFPPEEADPAQLVIVTTGAERARVRKSAERSIGGFPERVVMERSARERLEDVRAQYIATKEGKEAMLVNALNDAEAEMPMPGKSESEPWVIERLGDKYDFKPTVNKPLLHQRPASSGDDRLYFDLVAYAPGLNTSAADARAVLEAEAAPSAAGKPGVIEQGARALFTRARAAGWRSFTWPAQGDASAIKVIFDGTGRFTWERRLTFGLRERVVCDGTTLWHLYPDLGLAARRSVSRFHRLDFARRIPWALPQPEDLARGADLRVVKGFTVALVPHGAGAKGDDGKPLPYLQIQYTVARDGGLAERRLLEMPAAKTLLRETYSPEGTIKVFATDGKEITTLSGVLDSAKAPNLRPKLDGLVVLPLPYRTPEHVRATLGIEGKNPAQLHFEDGLALLAAEFASGNGDNAANVFRQCFHGRDQRQIGFYVLLAACGQNLDGEHLDVLGEHPDEPLAQYLALHSSPVLRKHASQWAAASNPWGDGFLHHLAQSHALGQRWQKGRPIAGRAADLDRALAFVRSHKNSAFGWAVLGLLADRAGDDEAAGKDARAVHRALAEAWLWFAVSPGLSYAARYEHARSLFKSGQKAPARKAFVDLYEQTVQDGALPPLDGDLRAALLGEGADEDLWSGLLRRTAARLVKDKKPLAVLTMARQCWEIGDRPQAGVLYAMAQEGAPAGKERGTLRTTALAYLWHTGQLAEADKLLQGVLAQAEPAAWPALWRLAAQLASRRDQPARELECLEQALDAEFAHLPEVVNVLSVRGDYERLLKDYQAQAEALVALRLKVPEDFRAKVVRTADRWRALDRDGSTACQMAARVLQTLGERELTWDYLTTPVALRPAESEPWANLAQTLARQGEATLADRAYAAAFEAEPTNAQLLWDRAQHLAQSGQVEEARKLYRRLADGSWQPRFASLQSQARWQLDRPGGR
jgi:tetratricopeptide (TPR) repeat protein